ncbi:MAG: DUF4956 domain-containing protein [Clostridia bacterium]|nr:DUF4956 domain-containing protein [Clostridia bacterium]
MNAFALLTAVNGNLSKNDIAGNSAFANWFANQLSAFTPLNTAIALGEALIAGIIIALVYKKTYKGVLYSPSFSLTLILLCLVTTPVVMAIGSNVALSMGMVGALSIVRFRTAVKDPLDTAYMFWSITMGILLGADAVLIAAVALLGISVIMLGLSFFRFRKPNAYLLVLHYTTENENAFDSQRASNVESEIESELRQSATTHRLRSKTVTRGGTEMTVEVRLDRRSDIVRNMLNIHGVSDATLVACQTETGA